MRLRDAPQRIRRASRHRHFHRRAVLRLGSRQAALLTDLGSQTSIRLYLPSAFTPERWSSLSFARNTATPSCPSWTHLLAHEATARPLAGHRPRSDPDHPNSQRPTSLDGGGGWSGSRRPRDSAVRRAGRWPSPSRPETDSGTGRTVGDKAGGLPDTCLHAKWHPRLSTGHQCSPAKGAEPKGGVR